MSRAFAWALLVMIILLLGILAAPASAAIVTDPETCARLGAPVAGGLEVVGCSWTENVLESRFQNRSCEPSEAWMAATGFLRTPAESFCNSSSESMCLYDEDAKCLFEERADQGCFTPPLQVLERDLNRLVASFKELYDTVETLPAICSGITNNVSCVDMAPFCEWSPTSEFPGQVRKVQLESKNDTIQIQEVQQVSVMRQLEQTQSQVQRVSVRAGAFEEGIVTISLTDEDISLIDFEKSYMKLVYKAAETGEIRVDASAQEIEQVLKTLPSFLQGGGFSVSEATRDPQGFVSSWEVIFDVNQDANDLELSNDVRVTRTGNGPPPGVLAIELTRHRHSKQQLVLLSNGQVVDGSFALRYIKPQLTAPGTAESDDTGILPFNATASQIRQALLGLSRSGQQLLSFVAVDVFEETEVSVFNQSEFSVLRYWNISLVGEIGEFEFAEFKLIPGFNEQDPCTACTNFTVIPGSRSGEDWLPLENAELDASASDNFVPMARMEVRYLNEAPKVHGFFHLRQCTFTRVLTGEAYPVKGSTDVMVVGPNFQEWSDFLGPGSYVRLVGRVHTVSDVTESGSNTLNLKLEEPFDGVLLESTIPGAVVRTCEFQVNKNMFFGVNQNGPTFAAQLEAVYPGAQVSVVTTTPNELLGEVEWDISFANPFNSYDPISFVSASETDRLMSSNAVINVDVIQEGKGSVSGSFRLAFAGYDGTENRYRSLLSGFSADPNDNSWGSLDDNSRDNRVFYTRPIRWNARLQEVKSALEELPNIIQNGLEVEEVADFNLEVNVPGVGSMFETWFGKAWKIKFLTDSTAMLQLFTVEELEGLSADLPQLAVADVSSLQGSDAQVQVTTIQNGNGTLFQVNQTIYTEVANNRKFSPCRVNVTSRNERIRELGIEEEKLEALTELDENMARCTFGINTSAVWNGFNECPQVEFSRNSGSEDSQDSEDFEIADASFCVWRGGIFETDFPAGVDPQSVVEFNWVNVSYGGIESRVRSSNCTVPKIYVAQQMLILFSLSEEWITNYKDLNTTWKERNPVNLDLNTNVSLELSAFVEQFNQCYEDLETLIQLPEPTFIRLWQEIITFTCYTVGFAYGVAGLIVTSRMRSLKLLSPKSIGSAILIVFGCFLMGGVIAFILGAIPAAIIFNIYSSIPHNLPFDSAISLGIGQGIIILYFDAGRGLRTTIRDS